MTTTTIEYPHLYRALLTQMLNNKNNKFSVLNVEDEQKGIIK